MHLRFVHVRPLAGFFLCNKLIIEASNTYITVCNERMLSIKVGVYHREYIRGL